VAQRAGAMEDLVSAGVAALRLPEPAFWRGRRVLVTGHTGFKGSWLALWLKALGAEVTGFALAPPGEPNLFTLAGVERDVHHVHGDVRDAAALDACIAQARPQVVLHLAAQSLVRLSYREPVQTYATNVMGTVHLLDAVRRQPGVEAVLVVTSDKCYENREWLWGYRENEAMGGHDPYSNSKGCAELVTSAMRRSFFADGGPGIGSARAGNVIGGGDWADDRLLPDAMRAFIAGQPVVLRSPQAVRPWQHVLEPLRGYLLLAEALADPTRRARHAQGWNFGPDEADCRAVADVVSLAAGEWPGARVVVNPPPDAPHEANLLRLDCTQAHQQLAWRPHWRLERGVAETVAWFRAFADGQDMRQVTLAQLAGYDPRLAAPSP